MYIYLNGERIKFKEAARILTFFLSLFGCSAKGLHLYFIKICAEMKQKTNPQIVPRLLCYLEIFSPKLPHTHTRMRNTCVKLMKEFKCTDMLRVVKSQEQRI